MQYVSYRYTLTILCKLQVYISDSQFLKVILHLSDHISRSVVSNSFRPHELQHASERLLLNHVNTPGFLAPGGEEFNPGPETRLDHSELLCNKVLLKYKGDRESF